MITREVWQSGTRWMKFNLVGAAGIAVQLGAVYLLTGSGMDYMFATLLAVEAAVLHNFIWHAHYTWADRKGGSEFGLAIRLLRFNLTTGVVSMGGNVLLVRLLVGGAHLPVLTANLASITACSVANFLVSDRWVFEFVDRAGERT